MTTRRALAAAAAGVAMLVPVAGCAAGPAPVSVPATAGDAIVSPLAPSPSTTRPMPSNQIALDGEQVARSAAAARAAGAFMRAFARPDLPEQAWWARVAPLLTASGRHAALGTDPARIPVTTVTGKAVVLPGAEKNARTVRVPTDIGPYTLFMLADAATGRWLVETYQPPGDVK